MGALGYRVSGGVGEDDFLAGVEALDLADLVTGGAGGIAGPAVVGAELDVTGAGVADEDPGGLAACAGKPGPA